eukprot:TRINITY_DN10531_c1_g1_i1.p1 TRINITY_DN10531_c1_g1~~TRINITY_DN10531_c1_g1_i1.p1  ORF type:complete len:586 (+),score=176.51 TRINITY_DN10531_c1_g1_i1:22-1758(+)
MAEELPVETYGNSSPENSRSASPSPHGLLDEKDEEKLLPSGKSRAYATLDKAVLEHSPHVGVVRAVIVDKNEEVIFSDIVMKFDRRSKHNVRTLMMTNVAMYNLKHEALRRRVPIQKIGSITASNTSSEVIIHIPEENDCHFVIADQHREMVIGFLQGCHQMLVGQELKVNYVDEDHLEKHVVRNSLFHFKLLRPRDSSNKEFKAHEDDQLTVDDFQLLKVLGKGAFGKVILARRKDNEKIYAIKILKKSAITSPYQETQVMLERHVLATMKHPFLMQLRFAFQTKEKLYFGTDFYKGGDLFFHLKKVKTFTEEQARFIIAEVALGLGHLHAHNFIYRDLKSENILLDNTGHICITDFGLTAQLNEADQGDLKTVCGTPDFVAPEMLTRAGYGKAVDWWALGILLYELTVGQSPFYSENINKMYDKIKWATVIQYPSTMSEDCKSLIDALMHKNPEKRLGFSHRDVEEIKEHPFFKDVNWDGLLAKEVESPIRVGAGKSDDDTSMFDDEHLNAPIDSPVAKKKTGLFSSSKSAKDAKEFDNNVRGFTFMDTMKPAIAAKYQEEARAAMQAETVRKNNQ